jgi:hypothetical protein
MVSIANRNGRSWLRSSAMHAPVFLAACIILRRIAAQNPAVELRFRFQNCYNRAGQEAT